MEIIVLFEKFGWMGFIIYLFFKEVIPSIVNYRKSKGENDRLEIDNKRLEAQIDREDLETIAAMRGQIKELVAENKAIHKEYRADIEELRKRIDYLETELRRYVNGYGRAIRYINKKRTPEETIPDFLLDTSELKTQK